MVETDLSAYTEEELAIFVAALTGEVPEIDLSIDPTALTVEDWARLYAVLDTSGYTEDELAELQVVLDKVSGLSGDLSTLTAEEIGILSG